MASIISAGTTSGTALNMAGDTSGVLQLATNGSTTAVTVDTSQNVGIGTTSPNYKLTFGGQTGATATPLALRFSNDFSNGTTAASSKIFLYNDGVAGAIFGFGVGQSADIQYHAGSTGASNGNHRWYTNDTERMRIDSSGNVMVGTTSNFGCLFAVSKAGSDLVAFKNTSVTSNAGNWAISLGAADNFILQNSNGAGVQVTWGATSWSSFSDERLKNVIGTYSDALSGVMELKPVKFTWKSDAGNKPQVGILAQSVQSVVPEAVEAVTMNEEDETKYLTVRYTELIPLLTAAIQEQQTIINDLKARITALEGAA
jgi:hypothetical protein